MLLKGLRLRHVRTHPHVAHATRFVREATVASPSAANALRQAYQQACGARVSISFHWAAKAFSELRDSA